MHEHICIYNSPMVKLHVQINASIFMKYTTICIAYCSCYHVMLLCNRILKSATILMTYIFLINTHQRVMLVFYLSSLSTWIHILY